MKSIMNIVSLRTFLLTLSFIGVLCFPLFLYAQTLESTSIPNEPSLPSLTQVQIDTLTPDASSTSPASSADSVSCFDYYRFGSVQVQLEGTLNKSTSGGPMHFRGKIINVNDYPVVDGAVYAKIFRKQKDDDLTHANGHNLIDQFFVKENLSLQAKGETPFEFDWQVPTYAASGDYQVAFFFTSAHKFNLLGLSFTDDVVGNTFDFSIVGDRTGAVAFNKNTVKIGSWDKGDMYYHFAAFPPHHDKDQDITTQVELTNTTDALQMTTVTWKLYGWDAQSEENLLDTAEETFMIEPNETRVISYIDTNRTHSVHLLVAEAKNQDSKSLLDIRYVRDGVDTLRLNFPSITNYPLAANTEQTVFSCLHNAGANTVPDGKLVLTLKDVDGKVIHEYIYEGSVTSEMMIVKDTFTPTETYKTFTLEAQLYSADTLVDSAVMTYDCNQLGGTDCTAPTDPVFTGGNDGLTPTIITLIMFGVLTALVFGIFVYFKRRGRVIEDVNFPIKEFVLLFMVATSFMAGGREVEAKSVVGTWSYSGALNYQATAEIWKDQWYPGLSNPIVSYTYDSYIYDNNTGAIIPDGSIVPVGTVLRFEQQLGGVSWTGSGSTMDTPAGAWVGGAAFPDGPTHTKMGVLGKGGATFRIARCSGKYFVNNFTWQGKTFGIYIPLSVAPPKQSISRDEGSQSRLSCSGNICTVVSPGTINTSFDYSATKGHFYYEYNGPTYTKSCQASWDLFPMSNLSVKLSPQSISYGITAVSPDNPPNAPTSNHIAPQVPAIWQGHIGVNQTFTAVATDPDGDTVQYGFDWGVDGSIDNWTATVASGGTGSITKSWATIGAKTYQVYARDSKGSLSGASPIYTINIINVPALSTFTAPNCYIAVNQSTCNTNVAWNINDPVATYISIKQNGAEFSTAAFDGGVARTMQYGTSAANTITIHDGISSQVMIGSITPAGICDVDTIWNGTACVIIPTPPPPPPPPPTATLTASNCSIPVGSNSCSVAVTWDGSNTTAPHTLKRGAANIVTNAGEDGNTTDLNLSIGTYTYSFHDNSGQLDTDSATVACTAGAQINPLTTNCEVPPNLPSINITADPKTVRRGNTSELDITIDDRGNPLDCKIYGADDTSPQPLNFPYAAINNRPTKKLFSTQEVVVECKVTAFPTVKSSATVRIGVEGTLEEV